MSDDDIRRLLCDEMLGRLARWLRAAGHDTALARPGSGDGDVVDQALAEDRLLLTRDRHIPDRKAAAGRVLLLEGGRLDRQAAELRSRLGLDWLAAPFSRCLVDNTGLRAASAADLERLPAHGILAPVSACPACGRLYWPGSHVRRMQARLRAWAHD